MVMANQSEKLWPRVAWHHVMLVIVATLIVHLAATFLATMNTHQSAYYRLAASLPLNTMQVLEPISPSHQPLPFMAPDSHYAVCRFSSAKGPVSVQATLPDRGWTVGIYHPDGSTAYFAAGAVNRPIVINLTIIAGEDRFVAPTPSPAEPAAAPELSVSALEGLIVVRSPDRGDAYRKDDERVLAQSRCIARGY